LNRISLFTIIQLFITGFISAQTPADTIKNSIIDSAVINNTSAGNDSLALDSLNTLTFKNPLQDSITVFSDSVSISFQERNIQILKHHPYFGFGSPVINIPDSGRRKIEGKELLFYFLILLLIIYALMRRVFSKYFNDLFRLFFKTTIKQRQISEQLIQTPLPSLLLNIFFVVSGGLYISFLLQYFKLVEPERFWIMFIYCTLGLSAAYILKFLGLKLTGWLFNIQNTADSYIFIVFIVNKMIGILLLPFLIILAFTTGNIYTVGITLSWCLVAGLFAYRFILTYSAIHKQVSINPFHFLLYLCAFEISPLLLVYKALLYYFG